MSGLTPKKKEELKQMMGKYSGKVFEFTVDGRVFRG